ncbi:P-loop containing nucleoside triphosphate hydrolase protein [Triangularia verruculosa]|uniref:Kinesin-like protein n=1 Tax=Triangularia verruculosa TaxID=2587418 RepID=A0AAN6XL40_9PEZI|nr:P-loop containing nucleoside triphosphate hydrolase protein [Triangularia verruculosa]
MAASRPPQNLFEVYLRLRPHHNSASTSGERFLAVEEPDEDSDAARHITLNPPNDRRRAVEKFAFTQVFEEDATQLDVFHCTGVANLVEGVLAPYGGDGTDALLATMGVTGSGKSHTILGSKSQRGMIQLALDVIFRSLSDHLLDCSSHPTLEQSIASSDPSEALIFSAQNFLENVYADAPSTFKSSSRAPTPMLSESIGPNSARRINRPSAFPQQPDISALSVSCDPSSEYAVVVSMYEVYNDRIFDLLTPPVKSSATKEYRRRPLLFKPTETSPDRKIVAGLRKVICGSLQEALLVLEAGLHERRVTGTSSNSVSSRSHGFFCVEVKKRTRASRKHGDLPWGGSTLTIVDLAGSERARDAKTAGATLAEAGKINESLMYLGQCLQMQSDAVTKDKPNLVPFRQCKLTELLFSNCFPSASSFPSARQRNPQKAVMIVTADPHGDYNATSQILRYSALAREVTVPRVPSITHTILSAPAPPASPPPMGQVSSPSIHHRSFFAPPGSSSSNQQQHSGLLSSPNIQRAFSSLSGSNLGGDAHRGTMEAAALEIARLSEELEYLRQALESERSAREEAEAHLLSMEDRMIELEQAIREDCTNEFEQRLEIEMARWKTTMQIEMERGEEHWGRKIEVFERSLAVAPLSLPSTQPQSDYEEIDGEDNDKENILMEDMEQENERLKRENEILRREVAGMSPSKRRPLGERSGLGVLAADGSRGGSPRPTRRDREREREATLRQKLENLRMDDSSSESQRPPSTRQQGGSSSPKKMRRLQTKRWNEIDDDDMF